MVAPSPRVTQRDRAIEAATDLARRDGLGAITSVAVAQRLGVTQSAVYRHIRDVDELRTLAIHRLVAEVDDELGSIVREVGQQWTTRVDFNSFVRRVVDAMARHSSALCLLDRWRFAENEIGEGIRTRLLRGRDGIAAMLESEWIRTRGHPAPLTATQKAMLRAHAQLVQDDLLGVARFLRNGRFPGGREALVAILKSRSLAAWTAFRACMEGAVLTTVVPAQRDEVDKESGRSAVLQLCPAGIGSFGGSGT
jgi:AcrR family transcriptional regulator